MRGEERILRRGWWARGRPRTLSGVAKSEGVWGVADWQRGLLWVTGLDWTEAALTGAAFSSQLADLHNYTQDATYYEIYPYQKKVSVTWGYLHKASDNNSIEGYEYNSCCTIKRLVLFLEVILSHLIVF